MSFLNEIAIDHKNIIVSLPYRVGLWVSLSDDTGGSDADKDELNALENIINGFTQEVFGSEVVQHIMTETWNRKAEWPHWGKNLDRIPEECQIALDALNDVVEEKEVSAYKLRLIEIGEAVALAFREYEDSSVMGKIKVHISYYMAKYKAKKRQQIYKTLDQYLNISIKERQVLNKVADALGTVYY